MLGKRWAGARVRIVPVDELVQVYYGRELLRVLAPDRSRRYQRLGTGEGKAVVAGKR